MSLQNLSNEELIEHLGNNHPEAQDVREAIRRLRSQQEALALAWDEGFANSVLKPLTDPPNPYRGGIE